MPHSAELTAGATRSVVACTRSHRRRRMRRSTAAHDSRPEPKVRSTRSVTTLTKLRRGGTATRGAARPASSCSGCGALTQLVAACRSKQHSSGAMLPKRRRPLRSEPRSQRRPFRPSEEAPSRLRRPPGIATALPSDRHAHQRRLDMWRSSAPCAARRAALQKRAPQSQVPLESSCARGAAWRQKQCGAVVSRGRRLLSCAACGAGRAWEARVAMARARRASPRAPHAPHSELGDDGGYARAPSRADIPGAGHPVESCAARRREARLRVAESPRSVMRSSRACSQERRGALFGVLCSLQAAFRSLQVRALAPTSTGALAFARAHAAGHGGR